MQCTQTCFSIVCPTYNRANLLKRAIRSVLRQEFKDFELIIVSDGSTDNTREVVRSFNDNRIIFIEHKTNLGINAARNTGFALTKGQFFALLDDDDELAPHALNMAFNTFRCTSQKVLFFNCIDVEAKQISGKFLPKPRIITYFDLLSQKLNGDYWIVVEHALLPNGKIFDEGSGGAGYTWLRLLQKNNAYYSPKIAYFAYRQHNFHRITNYRSWTKREFNAEKIIREFGEDMKLYCPGVYSKQAAILAFYQVLNKKIPQARVNLLISLKTRFSPYAIALLFLTFTGNVSLILIHKGLKRYFEKIHF